MTHINSAIVCNFVVLATKVNTDQQFDKNSMPLIKTVSRCNKRSTDQNGGKQTEEHYKVRFSAKSLVFKVAMALTNLRKTHAQV